MIGTDEEKTQIYNQVMQKGLRKFDRKIENLHQEIMNIESNNTMLGSKDRNKYWELHDKGRKRTKKDYEQFDRLKRKARLSKQDAHITDVIKRRGLYVRRSYYRFTDVLEKDYRVQVRKVWKDHKGEIRMYYQEDK